jgi:hypothetical protein
VIFVSSRLLFPCHLFVAPVATAGAGDLEQLVKKIVQFSLNKQLLVTSWISGDRNWFSVCDNNLDSLLFHLAQSFAMRFPRLYVVQGEWKKRIRIDASNFADYMENKGVFHHATNKLYVHDESTPTESPEAKKLHSFVDEGSQSAGSSSRSGQSEFRTALLNRDGMQCVFCGCQNPPLEAAHVLPVEQRHLLQDRNNCAKFGVNSIMDTANGILLCWGCHKCFDANLVCINSDSGQLSIADALLSNEKEKWSPLVGRVVPVSLGTWPTKALLKYREELMKEASERRQRKQEEFTLYCEHCNKGYKMANALQNHQDACCPANLSPASYTTPKKEEK